METDELLQILKDLDVKKFREVVDAPAETSDRELIEAIHITRTEHGGINRKLKNDSKRWIAANTLH